MNLTSRLRHMLVLAVLACAFAATALAQDPFDDAIKQFTSDNVKGYLQPFANAFCADLGSGYYHSADISDIGLTVRLDLVGMGTIIGDAEKTFTALPPSPFGQSPIPTATVYGDLGAVVTGPGNTQYQFQNGQIKTSLAMLGAPQLTIGNIFGTQAVFRYIPFPEISNFPKVTVVGGGVRHSISRYLPASPVDIAAGIFYTKADVGDFISGKSWSFGAQASKSFSVLTVYGGLQYESSTMSVTYAYTGPGSTPGSAVNLDLDGENKFRVTAGFGVNLVLLNLNADVSVGKVTTLSGALGFGL